ncbi:amidohydrolase [Kordiimonas sediminis]|uniref:Amidohydrolase n=1 Tax=Kordiimonas sediminis TaxID=1735581 RepID=A0A919AJT0_9PROT|nr:amidohydrolase [Kordiimonas sediminis]GHF11350.1 amidohydrolase [Kordiimonas sediminis]
MIRLKKDRTALRSALLVSTMSFALIACGGEAEQGAFVERNVDAFASTYTPLPSETTFITNVSMYDGKGGEIERGSILMEGGKIKAVGTDLTAPDGAKVIDGTGKWVTPGIIDVHSHLGVYPSPSTGSHSDGNEVGEPVTADVWAEHSNWPQDPGYMRAAAGGVTALQLLPGSANLIGGRSATIKNVPGRTNQDMKFPGAPYGVKFACGENPKRVYGGGKNNPILARPHTRMGNVAGFRQAFADGQDYIQRWEQYERDYKAGKNVVPPKRDLKMDTIAGILEGEIIVHNHCYRADDMGTMLDVAKEFGFKIGTFHHGVESYKIADRLRDAGTCSAMWADWYGFKMEAFDGIKENIPLVHNAGACAIVHSDDDIGIQRLNQEAAKALADGNKAGLNISKATAWTWLSLNPAKSLGVEEQTGTLDVGKDADVVLWSGNPFSVYSQAEITFVDGAVVFDRNNPDSNPVSDFELGMPGEGDTK